MTPQVDGIIMGIFAVLFSIFLYWGGYAEQRRANKAFASKRAANREPSGDGEFPSPAPVRGEEALR